MRIRHALLIGASAAAAALALTGCTGNTPPPNYATTAPGGGGQAPAATQPAGQPAPAPPDGDGREYERCTDALVDAWLHAGTGDDVSARDVDPRSVGWGTQPTGDARVACAVELDLPEGAGVAVLTVLTGDGVPDAVATAAADQDLAATETGQTGAVASYAAADDSVRYTLFGPPDPVLSTSGIAGADDAHLLEGTRDAR